MAWCAGIGYGNAPLVAVLRVYSYRYRLDDECLESFCKAEGRANELRLDSTLRASNNYAYGVLLRQPVCAVPQGARDYPEPRASCCPSPHSQQRREGSTALLALLCGFSPTLLLPRRPIRRSYALHRPASFCTAVRCYKLAATQLYCGAYNKAVGCPEARLSHPRIQRSYALYPPGV